MRTDRPTALVAYATRHGSTQEVAEAVGERLRLGGRCVDVRPARDVDHLLGVDAVVLGGALYTGRWHRDARRFLQRHHEALRAVPFAAFALGPKTLEPKDVASSRSQLEHALDRYPDLTPLALAIFGGVVDPAALPFPFSRMEASDARDWDDIHAWADALSRSLAARGAPHLVT